MNDIYVGTLFSEDYLAHHGILGMKWGVRRFQKEDGSLTSAGKKRKSLNEKIKEVRETHAKRNKIERDSEVRGVDRMYAAVAKQKTLRLRLIKRVVLDLIWKGGPEMKNVRQIFMMQRPKNTVKEVLRL